MTIIALLYVILTSCSLTIPMQSSLNDQIILLTKNKDIKVNIALNSKISDGYINFAVVSKNGTEHPRNNYYIYSSETAFKKIWTTYFSNKFNSFSEDEMNIQATLKELKLANYYSNSTGRTLLTGQANTHFEAIAIIDVIINYHGKKYKKQIEVNSIENKEIEQRFSTLSAQMQSKLLEDCLNKSIIYFDNIVNSILLSNKK